MSVIDHSQLTSFDGGVTFNKQAGSPDIAGSGASFFRIQSDKRKGEHLRSFAVGHETEAGSPSMEKVFVSADARVDVQQYRGRHLQVLRGVRRVIHRGIFKTS